MAAATAGSHRDLSGNTLFTEEADVMSLVDGESENSPSGLVAVCAPPGTCMLTDTRILHSGGRRTAEGTRYAMRIHCESAETFSTWPLLPTIFPPLLANKKHHGFRQPVLHADAARAGAAEPPRAGGHLGAPLTPAATHARLLAVRPQAFSLTGGQTVALIEMKLSFVVANTAGGPNGTLPR